MCTVSKALHLFAQVLIVSCLLIADRPAKAGALRTLYNFSDGLDGRHPLGVPHGVIASGSILYGVTSGGGKYGGGTVFSINTNATAFTVLYSFTGIDPVFGTNTDGAGPNGVVLSGANLYGTTTFGGVNGNGTLFSVGTNGSNFQTLHTFSETDSSGINSDGSAPYATLISSDGNLYGTTTIGGSGGSGTVFSLATDGSGFTTLHNFKALSTAAPNGINNDGAAPYNELTLSSNTLFGSATYGGMAGNGTLYQLNVDGTDFKVLYTFSALGLSAPVNADGAYPNGLIFSGATLYGTANYGGASGNGAIFAFEIGGSAFTNLYNFTALDPSGHNSDGADPVVSLAIVAGMLYGTTPAGGSSGNGTIFALKLNGTGFTNLHSFTATNTIGVNADGAAPQAGVIPYGDLLFGTAYEGGAFGDGTIFGISLPLVSPPSLSISLSGSTLILTWPANASGFGLQTLSNLAERWTNLNTMPAIVNGQNIVTNPRVNSAGFFRLVLQSGRSD